MGINVILRGVTRGALVFVGGYNAATNTPDLDVSPSNVKKGDTYTVTEPGDFFTEAMQVGDQISANIDDPVVLADWTRTQKNTTQATESVVGFAKIVTQVLADAGVDDLTFFTAKKLKAYANTLLNLTGLKVTGDGITVEVDTGSGQDYVVMNHNDNNWSNRINASGHFIIQDKSNNKAAFKVEKGCDNDELKVTPTGVSVLNNLDVSGTSNLKAGIQIAVNIQSGATYQILKTDHFLVGDNSSNNVAFTLPAIIDDPVDNGRLFVIEKFENGDFYVSIDSAGAEEINGETTGIRMGLQNDSVTLIASGGNWFQKTRNTGAFASMNIASVPTSAQAIGSVTPVVVNGYDTEVFETPGILSADATADTITADHIESASQGGDGFRVSFQLEIDYSLNNQELLAEIFLDGVATGVQDLQPTSNAFNTILKADSIIQIPDGVAGVLDVRLIASSAGNAIYHESNFVVQRLTK